MLLAIVLAACGGGGDEGESPAPPDPNAPQRIGRGSLTIEQPSAASAYSTESDSVLLSGSAFISPTHFRCCSGSADDTGVTVTSSTGSAVLQTASYCQPFGFGPLSLCDHFWSTRIENLAVGSTRVTLEARDPSGNIGRDSITITRLPDRRPPSIEATIPSSGASGVSVNASVRVTFNEPMDAASISTGTFQLKDPAGNLVPGTVTAAGVIATFHPTSSLAGLSSYTATMTTEVRDLSGNVLSASHSWAFTTAAAPDLTPPQVTATTPAAASSCADIDGAITVTFNESIDASTVGASTFTLRGANQALVSARVTPQTRGSLTLEPLSTLAFGSTYTATLAAGIRDLTGNAMPASFSWSFDTAAAGTGTWAPISTNGAPADERQVPVWTGSEMIVWGGLHSTGARYRPATDTWVPMSTVNAPSPRSRYVAAWTGTEMLVWGGEGDLFFMDGARYNPATDSWRPMSNVGAVNGGGNGTAAVWTESELITLDRFGAARYNPTSDSWSPVPLPPDPIASGRYSAIWTGTRLIIWGNYPDGCFGEFNPCSSAGAAYDPSSNTWSAISNGGAPPAGFGTVMVWTGSEMAVWGGAVGAGSVQGSNSGALYNPQADTWRPISTNCTLSPRIIPSAVQAGSELIVWGGQSATKMLLTGARYDPATNSWRQMSVTGAPSPRAGHSAVWTGTAMLVWGIGSPARYTP